MTRRTLSSGSAIAASRGKLATSSRTRASYREPLTPPTLKPKFRSVPRNSHSRSSSLRSSSLRSEEHTSELQSRRDLVCRLLLEKKKKKKKTLLVIKTQNNKKNNNKTTIK